MVRPTPTGLIHYIMLLADNPEANKDVWDKLPELNGMTKLGERKTGALMRSPFAFKKYGQCGMDVSELFPHVGEMADDICLIRSVYTDIPNHEPGKFPNPGNPNTIQPQSFH